MKKAIIAALTLAAAVAMPAGVIAQEDGEWVGIGTGSYQPGILDCNSSEYPELMPAAVYESSTREGVYKFVPTLPADGAMAVYEIVVHTADAEKVWCEDAPYFAGFMNFTVRHKVSEADGGNHPENYGKLVDGAIRFETPCSFKAMQMMGYVDTNLEGRFALYLPGSGPGDDPILQDTWEVMGMGKYTEGLLDCEYEAGITWDVEVEKSVEHPGCYRMKPYFEGNPSCPNLPEVADTYIYIHAENDMEVYTTDFVLLNNMGRGYKIQHRAVSGSSPDYSYYGTLEDGVITFPRNSHYATVIGIQGAGGMMTNTSGKATIVLPGGDYKDYYLKGEHPVCAESSGDGFCRFPFRINAGADVAGVAVAVEAGTKTIDEIDPTYYIEHGSMYPAMFLNYTLNMNFPLAGDEFKTNRWTMILVAVDANSQPVNTAISTFFTPEMEEKWVAYGKGEFRDLLLCPSYGSYIEANEVEIEVRADNPGRLRLVNPYEGMSVGSGHESGHTDHPHYIYINAEDPTYVYLEESVAGFDFGYGDAVISSAVGSKLNARIPMEEIRSEGVPAGTLTDGEVTFPAHSLYFFETKWHDNYLQPCGEGTLLTITEYSGIESVEADSASGPVTYYDLRGVKVENPVSGVMYIRVQGDKATKIIKR